MTFCAVERPLWGAITVRQLLYLPQDDLHRTAVSRSGLARLEDVIPKAEGETVQRKKTFKSYEPGFVHVDIKYLPQMADESSRRYLFVAIDRATRWVFIRIYNNSDQGGKSSVDFLLLLRLMLASSVKIHKPLTYRDSQFTGRCAAKDKN